MTSALHLCKFIVGLEQPASQVTEKELALLLKYSCDSKTLVEIGCYEGKTSVALAGSTTGTVEAIDPFFTGRLGICYSEIIARIHRKRKRAGNLYFRKGYSFEVAGGFDKQIDFLFIDADHSYEGITKDWNDWFPKVKHGGIIALHDCKKAANSPKYIGSMKFYDHDIPAIKEIEEIASIDSLVLFRVK